MANRYGAKRTEYNGASYDSGAEASFAGYLDLLVKSGHLKSYTRQVPYDLRGVGGTHITKHIVDFVVTWPDGDTEAWEYKGYPTDVWKLKRKLFEDNYPDLPYRTFKFVKGEVAETTAPRKRRRKKKRIVQSS